MLFFLVLLYLYIAFLRPQEFVQALMNTPLVPASLGLAVLFWIISSKKNLDGPVWLLMVLFLATTSLSHVFNGWVGGAIAWLPQFGVNCILFFLLAATCTTTRRVHSFMYAFVLCGLVMVYHGVQQVTNGIGFTGMDLLGGRIRYIGALNDPNDLGMFLVMGYPFILLFFQQSNGLIKKVFWLSVAGYYLVGVYYTQSRGTMLAVGAIMALMTYRRFGVLPVAAMGAVLLSAVSLLPSRMSDLSAEESSAQGRVDAWYAGMQMLESNPLFGVGAGRFTDHHHLTAHSTYVLVLAETGIIGFYLFVAILGYCLVMTTEAGMRRSSAPREPPQTAMLQEIETSRALLYSLIGFCATAFFLSRAYTIYPYIIFGMISGYYAILRKSDNSLPEQLLSTNFFKWWGLTILGVAFFYILVKVLIVKG